MIKSQMERMKMTIMNQKRIVKVGMMVILMLISVVLQTRMRTMTLDLRKLCSKLMKEILYI